jgi:hypothetical protein
MVRWRGTIGPGHTKHQRQCGRTLRNLSLVVIHLAAVPYPASISATHAQDQNALRTEKLRRHEATSFWAAVRQASVAHGVPMQIDRARTERFIAMPGLTLSHLLLLAVIALSFV